MTRAEGDAAILYQIHELAGELADDSSRATVKAIVAAVSPLNPQPLPPATLEFLQSLIDAATLES